MTEFFGALGCSRCKHIWGPRTPGKKPKQCPKCKRYENGTSVVFVWLKVPADFFKRRTELPEVKSFALPDVATVTCSRCGEQTSRGGIIDNSFQCPNCVLQTMLEKQPKQLSWRELEMLKEPAHEATT